MRHSKAHSSVPNFRRPGVTLNHPLTDTYQPPAARQTESSFAIQDTRDRKEIQVGFMIFRLFIALPFGLLSGLLVTFGLSLLLFSSDAPEWFVGLCSLLFTALATYIIEQPNRSLLAQIKRGFFVTSLAAYSLIPCFAFQDLEEAKTVPQIWGQMIAKGIEISGAFSLMIILLSGYGLARLFEFEQITEEKLSKAAIRALPLLKIAKVTVGIIVAALGFYLIKQGLK